MKTILCFGDTNTWGVNPVDESRLQFDKRWTGILTRELEPEIRVIEEGQCGRTTVCDDPVDLHKNGMDYLLPCLDGHRPLDLVVIMLGTVQLKGRFHQSAEDIALGIERIVQAVLSSGAGVGGKSPKILLISPIRIGRVEEGPLAMTFFMNNNRERQQRFKELYGDLARRYGIGFLSAEDYAETSELDGIHIAEESHYPFAMAVAEKVREMLGQKSLEIREKRVCG